MTISFRTSICAALAAMAVTVGMSAVPAAATPAPHRAAALCVPVRFTGAGQDLGPDSRGRLHTTATIALATVRIGVTDATFTPAGPPAGSQLDFTGPIVFRPDGGSATLTAQVQGRVDLATGIFAATSVAVTGTGAFRHVSGDLTFRGTENLSTGAFTETITGRLCAV